MLFAGHMGMGFQLRVQVGLQDRSFHRRSTRNRFGQDLPCLSPTFEVPFDGGNGHAQALQPAS